MDVYQQPAHRVGLPFHLCLLQTYLVGEKRYKRFNRFNFFLELASGFSPKTPTTVRNVFKFIIEKIDGIKRLYLK